MAIQNNLEAPITATSASDALKQYEEAKKEKKSANKKPKAKKSVDALIGKPKGTPVKKKAPAKKKATKKVKKAKAAKKVKRTFNAAVTGTTLTSRMVRISTDLADYLTGEAAKNDITVTEASRVLHAGLLR